MGCWGKYFGLGNSNRKEIENIMKMKDKKKDNVRLTDKNKEFIKAHIEDMTQAEIARKSGCHISTVIYYVKKYSLKKKSGQGCKWNLANAQIFKAMYSGGASMEEIAKHFDISLNSIQSARKRIMQLHGLEIKRKPKDHYAIAY